MRSMVILMLLTALMGPGVAFARDEIESNNSTGTATAFGLGDTLYGSLYDAYDVDYWKVDLQAGQEVKFDLLHNGSLIFGTSDMDLFFYNSAGSLLDSSETYPNGTTEREIIEYTIGSNGTYYLRVLPFSVAPAAKAYSITTTLMNPATSTPTDTPTATPTITPTKTPQDTPTPVESSVKSGWELYQ